MVHEFCIPQESGEGPDFGSRVEKFGNSDIST